MTSKHWSASRLIALALLLVGPAPATAQQHTELTSEQLHHAQAADVVLLGEVHDNPHHHRLQAQFIAALSPKAVVFEMLSDQQTNAITPELRQDPDALGDALGWADSGWPDFELYKPVFAAIPRQAAIVGAALERPKVRRAFSEGAAAVFGPTHRTYGLDRPLPQAQQSAREQMQYEAHCEAMPIEMMPGMVEAQRLRDAAFADTVLKALTTYGAPIVLIAGNGHTRTDWGVPALLKHARPDVALFSVGMLSQPQPAAPFDLVIVKPHQRANAPCDAFRP